MYIERVFSSTAFARTKSQIIVTRSDYRSARVQIRSGHIGTSRCSRLFYCRQICCRVPRNTHARALAYTHTRTHEHTHTRAHAHARARAQRERERERERDTYTDRKKQSCILPTFNLFWVSLLLIPSNISVCI